MLTAKNLEKIIELENTLKAEYQVKLDAQSAQIESLVKEREQQIAVTLKEKEGQQAVIATQLQQISNLSTEASAKKRAEQLNRELTNRSDKLQTEVAESKKRAKALQKDLAKEREELKALKQFDPAKMKKNLDAAKKKLAENQTANDLLQKSLNKIKGEKADFQQQVKELEAKLKALEVSEEKEEEAEVAAA